ncbi:protein of unknown function [Flavobacterium phragmitis]|uniref:Uncharacterized protein n=2 Tax=Flavobacterium phragmitis TaxID=739143 RepID=A0A1I1RWH2_9FLAO|nr:protein of unknown function [Flavobacterium phragmitis]
MTNLSRIILSGQTIDELEEYGMLETNYLTASQVKKTLSELNQITEQTLRDNFKPEVMNLKEVYCNPFDDSFFDYLLEYFNKVKDFYFDTAQQNKAVITYIIN